MTPATWPCPLPGGGNAGEYAVLFDKSRSARLLIVPALFDEGNKLRRLTLDVMRALDAAGIDSVLPDLPGCNESLQPLDQLTPQDWAEAMTAAARHFGASHVLGIRGGCLITPAGLPGWHYAPVKGASILRQLLRARILASREAGREEGREALEEAGRTHGIELAGYRLNAAFFRQFEALEPVGGATEIAQGELGGSGLWLRAEPGDSLAQAEALAARIAADLRG